MYQPSGTDETVPSAEVDNVPTVWPFAVAVSVPGIEPSSVGTSRLGRYAATPSLSVTDAPSNAVAAMGAAAAAGAPPGAASPAAQQPGMAEPPQATWRHLQMHGSPDGKLTRYDQRPSTLARAPLAGYSQRNVSSM